MYKLNPVLEFFGIFKKDKYDLMVDDQVLNEAKSVITIYKSREIPKVKKFINITQKKIEKLTKKPLFFSRKLSEFDLQELKELKEALRNGYLVLSEIREIINDLLICIKTNNFSEIKNILKQQPQDYDFSQKLIMV